MNNVHCQVDLIKFNAHIYDHWSIPRWSDQNQDAPYQALVGNLALGSVCPSRDSFGRLPPSLPKNNIAQSLGGLAYFYTFYTCSNLLMQLKKNCLLLHILGLPSTNIGSCRPPQQLKLWCSFVPRWFYQLSIKPTLAKAADESKSESFAAIQSIRIINIRPVTSDGRTSSSCERLILI